MNLHKQLLSFMQGQKKNSEYTELEYLESTGTQWIDTGFNGYATIELKAQGTEVATSSQVVVGATSVGGNFFGAYSSTNQWGISSGTGLSNLEYTDIGTFTIYFKNNKTSFDLNGVNYVREDNSTVNTTYNYNLFRCFGLGASNYYSKARIFYCKIWDENNKLVRYLIPVLDKDLTPCMYDKVSGEYLYNQGDGEFKWKLPNQLEYLESIDEQFIDTLVPVSENTGALIDAEWIYEDKQFSTLSGCYQSFMVLAIVPTNRRICYSYNSDPKGTTYYPLKDGTTIPSSEVNSTDSSLFITENGRFQVGLNYLGSKKWTYKTASESYETDLGETVVQNNSTITLFGRRYNDIPEEKNSYLWRGKIYSAIFTEGDKIVHYFVPVYDEDLIPCMYDLVSKEYFRNNGLGKFNGCFKDGSRVVSYLTASGTQWIDTEITPLIGDEIELKNVQCKKKSSGMQAVFSAGIGDYQTVLLVADGGYPTRGAFYKYFATGGAQNVNEPYFLNDPTTIRVDGEGNIYYNGEFIIQSPPVQETDGTMRLFYRANDSSPLTGNIGSVSIKRDGEFIINLVPVVKSDNTVCMLDLVSGEYFVNQGSGTFNYG